MIRPSILSIALFALCLPWLTPLWAAEFIPVSVEGVVVKVLEKGVLLRTDQGVDYEANIDPQRIHDGVVYKGFEAPPEVSVSGKGLPPQVRIGSFVEFEADLNKRRRCIHEIPSLKITTVDLNKVGCYKHTKERGVSNEQTPFEKIREGKFKIIGPIIGMEGHDIAVQVARQGAIQGKVANPPLIEIDTNDLRYAVPGDRAVLKGFSPKLPFVFVTSLAVKRGEKIGIVPPKQVAAAEPPKERPNEVGGNNKPPGNDKPQKDKPKGPDRNPLTVLKVN